MSPADRGRRWRAGNGGPTRRRAPARPAPAVLLALSATVLLAVVTACGRFTHPDGTTFCGTHIPTGAESVLFDPLDPGISAPLPKAPATSELPPPVPAGQLPGRADYIRTSPDCGHGAIVVVSPAGAAELVVTVPAGDGLIAGIGLVAVTESVTVAAWVSGRYEGALVLSSPLPAPTRS